MPRGAESVTYSLYVRGRADKELSRLPISDQYRLNIMIDELADNPYPYGYRKLQGREGYRIRVGDFRVLYLVDEEAREVTVTRVAHRRDVYR